MFAHLDLPARYLALFAIMLSCALAAGTYIVTSRADHRLNAQINRLCDDAYLLAGFWDGVRASTEKSLRDPTLPRGTRVGYREFVIELRDGSRAARATCPGHVYPHKP